MQSLQLRAAGWIVFDLPYKELNLLALKLILSSFRRRFAPCVVMAASPTLSLKLKAPLKPCTIVPSFHPRMSKLPVIFGTPALRYFPAASLIFNQKHHGRDRRLNSVGFAVDGITERGVKPNPVRNIS